MATFYKHSKAHQTSTVIVLHMMNTVSYWGRLFMRMNLTSKQSLGISPRHQGVIQDHSLYTRIHIMSSGNLPLMIRSVMSFKCSSDESCQNMYPWTHTHTHAHAHTHSMISLGNKVITSILLLLLLLSLKQYFVNILIEYMNCILFRPDYHLLSNLFHAYIFVLSADMTHCCEKPYLTEDA